MKTTILLVEDDPNIASLIKRYLSAQEYDCHWAAAGGEAMEMLSALRPNLVILDVMLPDANGASLCDRIRASSDVPIIMVTALSEDAQRLDGFARGVDDYICKPFNPRELVARVSAVLRRYERGQELARQISHQDIVMHLDERVVQVGGVELELTPIEFNMLRVFMSNPSKVLSREELLDASHDQYSESYPRSVDFHIKNLRRKVNVGGERRYIRSIYGVGYRLS